MTIYQAIAWIGVVLALSVAAAAVVSVLAALVCMALSPMVNDIRGRQRSKKIARTAARYARRFPVPIVPAVYRRRP